jgi:putative spermidine/putrescine transport system permease protein
MRWLQREATETQITHRMRLWLYLLATLVMAFLIVPTMIVVPMSFSASQYLEFPPREWSLRWYQNYLGSAS